jgi:hypothetical protein
MLDFISVLHKNLLLLTQVILSFIRFEVFKVINFCHHGKAHPQVADGATTSNMEGSCEYIE